MSAAYSYMIAEDEPLLARALAQQLSKHWPAARCAAIAVNGAEARSRLTMRSPRTWHFSTCACRNLMDWRLRGNCA